MHILVNREERRQLAFGDAFRSFLSEKRSRAKIAAKTKAQIFIWHLYRAQPQTPRIGSDCDSEDPRRDSASGRNQSAAGGDPRRLDDCGPDGGGAARRL